MYRRLTSCLLALLLVVTACSGADSETTYPVDPEDARRAKRGKLTGDGLTIFGGGSDAAQTGGATLGINSYLWRASLDTLSFVPLSSVDPRGGVIITDWYESPDAPGERFKLNATILDTRLRADGIRVSVFRQALDRMGRWRDAKVSDTLARELEDKILTRARELRIADARDE